MKYIALLNSDKKMLVDDEKYFYMKQFPWRLSSKGYAWWRYQQNKLKYLVHSHHLIIGSPSVNREVDHINGNRLDNRLKNLRIVTRTENQYNRRPLKNILGVHLETLKGGYQYWRAVIYKNNRRTHLGYFKEKSDAIKARRAYEKDHDIITQP